MHLVNYKEKYLKYKKKYLQLKGGANCPKLGFYQHIGECWHDSLIMILLYSDELSEHVQTIFDETPEYNFDIDECIEYAFSDSENTPIFMKPLNILGKDVPMFKHFAKEYIKSIFDRYRNDKLNIIPQSGATAEATADAGATAEPVSKKLLEPVSDIFFRLDSINETLTCNYSIFNIANINIKPTYMDRYTHKMHGGNIVHYITAILVYNFFLLNYFPIKLNIPKKLKYTNIINISLIEDFDFNFNNIPIDVFIDIIDRLISNLDMLNTLLDICVGICLNLANIEILENLFSEEPKEIPYNGHNVSFIQCNSTGFYYDDNGVINNDSHIEDPEYHDIDESLNEKLIQFPSIHRKNKEKVLVNFDWKRFLKTRIELAMVRLENMKKSGDLSRIPEFKEIYLDFSIFMKGHHPDDTITIGKTYLKDFFINGFNIITVHDFINYEDYIGNIQFIKSKYKKAYDLKQSIKK